MSRGVGWRRLWRRGSQRAQVRRNFLRLETSIRVAPRSGPDPRTSPASSERLIGLVSVPGTGAAPSESVESAACGRCRRAKIRERRVRGVRRVQRTLRGAGRAAGAIAAASAARARARDQRARVRRAHAAQCSNARLRTLGRARRRSTRLGRVAAVMPAGTARARRRATAGRAEESAARRRRLRGLQEFRTSSDLARRTDEL